MPPKRKANDVEEEANPKTSRRSSHRVSSRIKSEVANDVEPAIVKTKAPEAKFKSTKKTPVKKPKVEDVKDDEDEIDSVEDKPTRNPAKKEAATSKRKPTSPPTEGRQYWLMKAEPESRIEKGHDIKFSIDDLAAKTEPEPWDGIRAYPARNNLRAMKKGDMAFFYHSSCKVPAIVGTMTIVEEHTPDLTAHNPSAPYYDPKSKPSDPKWSVVHVTFKQKLSTPITLKQLKEWQQTKGHVLKSMQMLKLARLSVSKVSAAEWEFLIAEMGKNGDVVEE